jgi:hypothetical protein
MGLVGFRGSQIPKAFWLGKLQAVGLIPASSLHSLSIGQVDQRAASSGRLAADTTMTTKTVHNSRMRDLERMMKPPGLKITDHCILLVAGSIRMTE